jgi:DNA-binding NtrC family response regulator
MKRILIVEDQQVIRWVRRLALRDHFLVDEAEHAEAAWAQIGTRRPNGIVLDASIHPLFGRIEARSSHANRAFTGAA